MRTRELPGYRGVSSGFSLVAAGNSQAGTQRLMEANTEIPPPPGIAVETAEQALDLCQHHITECVVVLLEYCCRQCCDSVNSERSVFVNVGMDSPLQRAGLPLLQQQIQELVTAPAGEKQKHNMTSVFRKMKLN